MHVCAGHLGIYAHSSVHVVPESEFNDGKGIMYEVKLLVPSKSARKGGKTHIESDTGTQTLYIHEDASLRKVVTTCLREHCAKGLAKGFPQFFNAASALPPSLLFVVDSGLPKQRKSGRIQTYQAFLDLIEQSKAAKDLAAKITLLFKTDCELVKPGQEGWEQEQPQAAANGQRVRHHTIWIV
jgi:hypothetical protein